MQVRGKFHQKVFLLCDHFALFFKVILILLSIKILPWKLCEHNIFVGDTISLIIVAVWLEGLLKSLDDRLELLAALLRFNIIDVIDVLVEFSAALLHTKFLLLVFDSCEYVSHLFCYYDQIKRQNENKFQILKTNLGN